MLGNPGLSITPDDEDRSSLAGHWAAGVIDKTSEIDEKSENLSEDSFAHFLNSRKSLLQFASPHPSLHSLCISAHFHYLSFVHTNMKKEIAVSYSLLALATASAERMESAFKTCPFNGLEHK